MKKRGFGEGRWNGIGGKIENGESVEEGAIRESQEEIGVKINDLDKVAELLFTFPKNPEWDQLVHVYFVREWEGEPSESEEMLPKWFNVQDIPYENMWSDDVHWLPQVLEGKRLKADFAFGEGDVLIEKNMKTVQDFLLEKES